MGACVSAAAELPAWDRWVRDSLLGVLSACLTWLPLPPESEDRKDRDLQTDPQIVHFVRPSF